MGDLQNQLNSTALNATEKAALQKELAEAIANKEVKEKQAKEAVRVAKKAKKEREKKEAQVATAEDEAHKAVQEHAQTSNAKATKAQNLAAEAHAKVMDLQNQLNSTALSPTEKAALQKELAENTATAKAKEMIRKKEAVAANKKEKEKKEEAMKTEKDAKQAQNNMAAKEAEVKKMKEELASLNLPNTSIQYLTKT